MKSPEQINKAIKLLAVTCGVCDDLMSPQVYELLMRIQAALHWVLDNTEGVGFGDFIESVELARETYLRETRAN